MRRWKLVGMAIAGVIGVLGISYAGATTMLARRYDPNLMASWLQAVGSITAIGATGWIFLAQRVAEREKGLNAELLSKLRSARRAQSIAYWAVEAVERGAESLEGGGAGAGLPFRASRLDHIRQMMERVAEADEDHVTSLGLLAICRNLNEAYLTYDDFPQQYRDIQIRALYRIRDEARSQYDGVLAYQQKIEAESRARGILV